MDVQGNVPCSPRALRLILTRAFVGRNSHTSYRGRKKHTSKTDLCNKLGMPAVGGWEEGHGGGGGGTGGLGRGGGAEK